MLNIIDISNWQRGLNLDTMFEKNPKLDGVIVKATGGVRFVDNTCDPWVQWLRANNKPWGFYHFLDDDYRHSSGTAEARFFVENCRNYFGEGIPIADYEEPAKNLGTGYLKEFLDEVYRLTGVKPMVYCSVGLIPWQDFSKIAEAGYPLWIAQYPNSQFTTFQEHPWQNGSVSPFKDYVMHQYASTGRLPGWKGNLDLNLFYGDKSKWDQLAHVAPEAPSADLPEEPKKSIEEIAKEVLAGKWGIDDERKQLLTEAGYDYNKVQAAVNKLIKEQQDNEIHQMALDVIKGKYGNGLVRMIKLGLKYKAVQDEVNRILHLR